MVINLPFSIVENPFVGHINPTTGLMSLSPIIWKAHGSSESQDTTRKGSIFDLATKTSASLVENRSKIRFLFEAKKYGTPETHKIHVLPTCTI